MRVAIVGHEAAKFTEETEKVAIRIIHELLSRPEVTAVVSGRSPLGGIDAWAEEVGAALELEPRIYPPRKPRWIYYKERNLKIASDCDEAHCIVVDALPPNYEGEWRFPKCYHCEGLRPPHVKSGGCWTVMRARERGAKAFWHIIPTGEEGQR